jgi:hypothetical protein
MLMALSPPSIQHLGHVEVWWIQRPAGPRTSAVAAAWAAVFVATLLGTALWWTWRREEPLWPWQTLTPLTPSTPQIAVRYLSIAAAGLVYIVIRSLPGWIRLIRQVQQDRRKAEELVDQHAWDEAGLRLHRGTQLLRELAGNRPPPDWAVGLDRRIREHLSMSRRVYVYYSGSRPACPDSPEAGFAPRIVPVSHAGGWWVVPIVLVLAAGVFVDVGEAVRNAESARLTSFNFVLAAAIILVYAGMQAMALLGWRSYFRFAPGLAELLTYRIWRSRPYVDTIPLRSCDVMIDTTSWQIVLTLVDRGADACVSSYQVRRSPENLETCLRSVLSSAPIQSLSREELVQ